jgi:hypothetical protein
MSMDIDDMGCICFSHDIPFYDDGMDWDFLMGCIILYIQPCGRFGMPLLNTTDSNFMISSWIGICKQCIIKQCDTWVQFMSMFMLLMINLAVFNWCMENGFYPILGKACETCLQRVTGWRNLDWVGVFVLFLAINWGGVCN